MNELPPELPPEIRRPIDNQNRRARNFKFIVAMYAVAMAFLTFALHSGFNPLLRPAVILLCAMGAVALFLRYQTRGNRSQFVNPPDAPPPSSPEVESGLRSPISIEVVSVLSRIVNWAASMVIFAALAAAAVAYWTLTGGPKFH